MTTITGFACPHCTPRLGPTAWRQPAGRCSRWVRRSVMNAAVSHRCDGLICGTCHLCQGCEQEYPVVKPGTCPNCHGPAHKGACT